MAAPSRLSCVERTILSLNELFLKCPDITTGYIPIKRKIRDLNCGDIVVPRFIKLEPGKNEELLQFVQEAIIHMDIPVAHVALDRYNLLTFSLKRHIVIAEVISEVIHQKSFYGRAHPDQNLKVVLNPVSDHQHNSQLDYRITLVTAHVANLLKGNGYNVHLLGETKPVHLKFSDVSKARGNKQEVEKSCNYSSCAQDCQSSSRPHFIKKVKSLIDCQENEEAQNSHCLKVDPVVKEFKFSIGKEGIDKNLERIEVLTAENEASCILNDVINLEDELESLSIDITNSTCMHIISHQRAFRQQQILLLSRALSEKNYHQSQLTVGPVMCKKKPSMENIYSTRYMQMKQASEMRYGQKCEGRDWESRLNLLTRAGLSMDFLGTAAHSPLRIDFDISAPADSRMGAFVLYNTARLASLLHHFEQGVEKKTYPPLPPVTSVDFTLLREEEDWELLFVYIASYPGVVKDSVESVSGHEGHIHAKVHTHKGSEAHLLPLMYARLYLMQAAHHVLVSALELLGLAALDHL